MQSVFAVAGTLISDVVGLAEGFVGFILGEFGFFWVMKFTWRGQFILCDDVVGRNWERGVCLIGYLFDWFDFIEKWGKGDA